MIILFTFASGVSFFFFKQKTGYEMRISDGSSDVCSADLQYTMAEFEGRLANPSSTLLLAMLAGPPSRSRPRQGRYARMLTALIELGRASCRERVCQYVSISVVAVSLKEKDCHD